MTRSTKFISVSALLLIILGGIYLFFHFYENFHTIIPNQYYRSAELTPNQFKTIVKKYHIQSVINLRGKNPQYKWYRVERDTLKKLGVHFYSIPLSSYVLASHATLQTLAVTLLYAPKPVLMHCSSGADRTGLASAMILLLNNADLQHARQQISWKYGAIRTHTAGLLFLKAYEQWLIQHHFKHSTANLLKQWLGIRA